MVGAQEGVGELFAMSGTGLSTSREDLAEGYQRDGREVSRQVVPVITLDRVMDMVDGEIHWLKVDVEGAELQVVQGWHGDRRPWVLVIESTRPMSQEQSYEEWDALVVEKGYQFVYFDGLNRFYVSQAHSELAEAFAVGPNVFDRFSLSGTATSTFGAKLRMEISQLRGELTQLDAERAQQKRELIQLKIASSTRENALLADQARAWQRTNDLQIQLDLVKQQAAEAVISAVAAVEQERNDAIERAARLHADLMVIHRSTSWVVTAPLRAVARMARWGLKAPVFLARRAVAATVSGTKRLIFSALRRAARSSLLKRIARRIFSAVPGLERRVRALYGVANGRPVASALVPTASASLTSQTLLQVLSEPLPEGISAQAKQSLLRLRHAAVGAKD